MFRYVKALFHRPARRRPAPKVRLGLTALESREVATVSPWTAVGPQPEPPTKPAYAGILFPVFRPVGPISPVVRTGIVSGPTVPPFGAPLDAIGGLAPAFRP
jgi:hypothetical protein